MVAVVAVVVVCSLYAGLYFAISRECVTVRSPNYAMSMCANAKHKQTRTHTNDGTTHSQANALTHTHTFTKRAGNDGGIFS